MVEKSFELFRRCRWGRITQLSIMLLTLCIASAVTTADDPPNGLAPEAPPSERERLTQLSRTARNLVRAYQELRESSPDDADGLSEAKDAAMAATQEAWQLDMQIREKRLADARARLDRLAKKLKHHQQNSEQLLKARFQRTLEEIMIPAAALGDFPEAPSQAGMPHSDSTYPVVQAAVPPSAPSRKYFQYEGMTIVEWLAVAVEDSQDARAPDDDYFEAISRLRSKEGEKCWPDIRAAMQSCFLNVENELSEIRLAAAANCIVRIAGKPLQKEAFEYVLKIAAVGPRRSVDDRPNSESGHFLLRLMNELTWETNDYIQTITTKIRSGSSREREFVMEMLLKPPKDMQSSSYTKPQMHQLLESLLVASHDNDAGVQAMSLWLSSLFCDEQRDEELVSRIVKRCEEFIRSDRSAVDKYWVLMSLHDLRPNLPLIRETLQSWADSKDADSLWAAVCSAGSCGSTDAPFASGLLIKWLSDPTWGTMSVPDKSNDSSENFSIRFKALQGLARMKPLPKEAVSIFATTLKQCGEPSDSEFSDSESEEVTLTRELCQSVIDR